MVSARQNKKGSILRPFERLQGELENLIKSSQPGTRLMAEPDLAKTLGVSRATLREAMRSFEAQGLICRRQGVGTFVVNNPHVIESGLEVLESIETLAKRIHLEVRMGDLHIEQSAADAVTAQRLDLAPGAPVIRVSRVILAENRPVAYLVDTLSYDILKPEDFQNGFSGSVLDLLLRRSDLDLSTSIAEIQAVVAAPDIARLLQIQRGDVLSLHQARLYNTAGKIFDSR